MKYLMFVATDTEPDTDPRPIPAIEDWLATDYPGVRRVMGDRLRPIEDATTVRVRNGEVLLTDGPFTESREWIAGFDILDCDSLDAAVQIAAAHPMARAGRLELRPFWPLRS